jgi:hypothetical protein
MQQQLLFIYMISLAFLKPILRVNIERASLFRPLKF